MISLSQIDAAVKQVRYYNPDLELELLFLDEVELDAASAAKVANIRSALVARVADIVRQASGQSKALDASVSTVELLISSYSSHGDRSGQGHKHALQAIRLLASVSKRFDAAIDLFFDLVERFCAQNHVQGQVKGYTVDFAVRMMQNYDQTLVKLTSRQWSKERRPTWDIEKPIERIKNLRQIYGCRDNMSIKSARSFSIRKRQLPVSILFCESLEVLRSIRNRSTEMALAIWAKNLATQFRSWSRRQRAFDPTTSNGATPTTVSDLHPVRPVSARSRRKFKPRDMEMSDLKQQMGMLCAVIEKSARAKIYNPKISDLGSGSSYTVTDDTASLHSHKTGIRSRFHAV